MPNYKNFLEQGIYQFATDSNGNLQYISGTTELFGKQFLADILVVGHIERQEMLLHFIHLIEK